MRASTLALSATLALALTGGAFAQATTTPDGVRRGPAHPGGVIKDSGHEVGAHRTGGVPEGNPTQDTTGSVGHPKSTNSSGATTAPAAR